MQDQNAFVARLYDRFNARDLDGVLTMLTLDVVWANGMDGGHEHGHEGVRTYWTRQWAQIDPTVTPVATQAPSPDRLRVRVHAVIRDLQGGVLADHEVVHLFTLRDGCIARFDILED